VSPSTVERVLAGIVLGAVAWPVVRACASGAFRRAFPVFTGALLLLVAAFVLVVALAPLWALRVLVGIGLAMRIAIAWHAAVARGRARGWPPGSLRPLALGPWFDRTFYVDAAARLGSPFKTTQFLRPMACLVGLDDGMQFLKANETALGSPGMAFGRFIPGGFLRHMPLATHAAAKGLLAAAFTRDVYGPAEPMMRRTMRTELARMAAASDAAEGAGVPPRRHVQRMLFSVWMQLFYGIEPDAPERDRLKTLYRTLDIRNPGHASDAAVRDAIAEILAIARARDPADAADGPPGTFFAALRRAESGAVAEPSLAARGGRAARQRDDEAALVTNLVYLAHTSWADVSGLVTWVFRMLTEHGEWAERVRATPHAGTPPLPTRIVMETLRLEQSEHLYRVAERDLVIGDHVIPRGWLVRLCVRESHRDPRVFEHPERFDPDRFLHRTYTRREYSPFGGGLRHACLGEGLTTLVAATFAEELATGFRWRTVADGPPEYSAWRHWRPSSAWRVHVTALA
jgi:cytochrome P450